MWTRLFSPSSPGESFFLARQPALAFGMRSQHASGLWGPRSSACQLFLFLPRPAAHEEPLPTAVGYDACGKATRRLAEVLRSARVEAAGLEPASASAPSVRFYEHSSRFSFACRDGPGRRREASPLSVPSELRARTLRVSPLNDTGNRAVGRPDRWATV